MLSQQFKLNLQDVVNPPLIPNPQKMLYVLFQRVRVHAPCTTKHFAPAVAFALLFCEQIRTLGYG